MTGDDISVFLQNYPFLEEEQDEQIIQSYLSQHLEYQANRYRAMQENLLQINQIADENDEIKYIQKQSQAYSYVDLIQKYKEKFINLQKKDLYYKCFEFIQKTIKNIIYDPENQEYRQELNFFCENIKNEELILLQKQFLKQVLCENLHFEHYESEQNTELISFLYFYSETIDLEQFSQIIGKEFKQDTISIKEYQNNIIDIENDEQLDRKALYLQAKQRREQTGYSNQYQDDNEDQINGNQSVFDQMKGYKEKMRIKQLNSQKFNSKPITLQDIQSKQQSDFVDTNLQKVTGNNKQGFQKGQVITMDDLQNKQDSENMEKYGKQCLVHSNQFRKQQKLNPMAWSPELYVIALQHSKDMAEGKVPFGHQGFNARVKKCPFSQSSFGENVAYSSPCEEIEKQTVQGWINSPGHRKNLVSRANVCGIAAYKSNKNGRWYFTQLIVYKN